MINESELKQIVDGVVESMMRSTPPAQEPQPASQLKVEPAGAKIVAIGTDHGGLAMKNLLIIYLTENDYQVIDCGTDTTDSVDYPDIAVAVGSKVADGSAWRGIVIDGAGIGSCMAANKINGIRAAMCYDYATAFNSREHNNANVLTLGAGLIGNNLAKQIVKTFLETKFAGGRHAARVDKIMKIEK